MPIDIHIATGSTTPIYRQIVDQVRAGIASGQLAIGEKLPSVRQLAEELLVNPNTVAKAISHLVQEGVAESRHGRGAFVAKPRNIYSTAERKRRLQAALGTFIGEATLLNFSDDEIRTAVDQFLTRRRESKSA